MSIDVDLPPSFHQEGAPRQRGQGRVARVGILSLRGIAIFAIALFSVKLLFLDRAEQPEIRAKASLTTYGGMIKSLKFDPAGEILASTGLDGVIRLWDVATAQGIDARRLNEEPSFCLDFSRDGKTLITGGREKIAFWDPSKDDEPKEWWPSGVVQTILIAPDGNSILASDDDGIVRFWDAARRSVTATFDTRQSGTIRLKFAPDGILWAASGSDLRARIWKKTPNGPPSSHELPDGDYFALAFSPDAGLLFAGSRAGFIQVWDVARGRPLRRHDTGVWVTALAVSPDGRLLAYGSHEGAVTIFEPATRRTLLSRREHTVAIATMDFSRDGRLLASGDHDTIKIWDVAETPADPPR